MEAELTCVVESKEQGAGDGEGQDPDDGDHNSDSALGAVPCVVEHGHGHSCVPARAQGGGTPHSTTCTHKRYPSPWGWTVGPPPRSPPTPDSDSEDSWYFPINCLMTDWLLFNPGPRLLLQSPFLDSRLCKGPVLGCLCL